MDVAEKRMQDWLNTAVSGIRFGPDRKAVEEELRGHFEDKVADLQRIFHISQEEAEEMALERMGNAEKIGREMAKIHKPWLGYLWEMSRVLAWLCIILAVVLAIGGNWENPFFDGKPARSYEEPVGLEPEQVEVCGYSFRIMEVEYEPYGQNERMRLTVRATTPRFWEPLDEFDGLAQMTVVAQEGERFRMDSATVDADLTHWDYITGGELDRWGLFYREFVLYVTRDWENGERVWLEIGAEGVAQTLSVQVREAVEG